MLLHVPLFVFDIPLYVAPITINRLAFHPIAVVINHLSATLSTLPHPPQILHALLLRFPFAGIVPVYRLGSVNRAE
jgi:hypothetical protein